MIDTLLNIEQASKILLGAHFKIKEINPLDYCMNAMGVQITHLEPSSSEFNLLHNYCVRTWPEKQNASTFIKNIFRLTKHSEHDNFESLDFKDHNRWLLFHGSRISNFMGIMSQGLRIAPPEAPKTGYMFGKGVYFADMI